jgi:hypothetical protein
MRTVSRPETPARNIYPLVRGPEPAGHEGAVCIGEPVGQVEQGTCLR